MTRTVDVRRPATVPRAAAIETAVASLGGAKDRLAAAVMLGVDRERLQVVLDGARAVASAATQLRVELAPALGQATDDDIERALGMLVIAFPNPPKGVDLAGYGALLADDVRSLSPSLFAVETACTRLRRMSRFLPAISDVLAAIEAAEAMAARADHQAADLPRWIDKAARLLARGGAP